MKTLLLTLTLAATSLAMQDECKKEWDTQKLCFYNLFTNAVGMNDGYNILETSSLVKQCLQDAGCKVPKHMQNRGGHGGHHGGGGGSSEEDGGDNRRVKRGGDYQMGTPEMKQCMKEKFGGNPKDQVKECMAEKLPEGTYIPEKMLKPFHGSRKNSKCPYKKMMKFLAMTNTMDDRLNLVCDGDAAKVDQVVNCIQESTGVDVTNIDRDEVKATICEQKQSCFTDKLEGCRDQLQSMFMASCDCKMSIIEPKREQCMEELGVANHNSHAGMTCDQLKAKIESEYDMCADNFVWPSDEEGQGHGHHGRRGGPGGHKLLRNRRHVGEDGLDRDHTGSSEDDEDYSTSDEAVRVRRHDGRDHTGESQASDVSDEADDSEVSEDAIRRVRRHGDHGDDETSEMSDSEEVVAVRVRKHLGQSGHHDHAHGDGEDCGCALKQVITTNTKRNKRHDHDHDHDHNHGHGTGVHSSSEEDDKMMAFFF